MQCKLLEDSEFITQSLVQTNRSFPTELQKFDRTSAARLNSINAFVVFQNQKGTASIDISCPTTKYLSSTTRSNYNEIRASYYANVFVGRLTQPTDENKGQLIIALATVGAIIFVSVLIYIVAV